MNANTKVLWLFAIYFPSIQLMILFRFIHL